MRWRVGSVILSSSKTLLGGTRGSQQFLNTPSSCVICFNQQRNSSLQHKERKLVNIPQDVMYSVVVDVAKYNRFVPYCTRSVVTHETATHADAKLSVGFGPVKEHYNSYLTFEKPDFVVADCTDGRLFNHLKCTWKFSPTKSPNSSIIDFHVMFEFKSSMYNRLATMFFEKVVKTMVSAFVKEAHKRNAALKLARVRAGHH